MSAHFLKLTDLSSAELWKLVRRAMALKNQWRTEQGGRDVREGNIGPRASALNNSTANEPLRGQMVVMLFEQPSTRTRLSFEGAVTRLGGNPVFLSANDLQLQRGEPLEDTARVLSGMTCAIVMRVASHQTLETVAAHATVPVINALSDLYHPCQLLADVQTWVAHHGDIAGRRAAWIGDGNNVCHSWINAARCFGFALHIATPSGYAPHAEIVKAAGASVRVCETPEHAVDGADVVITDTWASMGAEHERQQRMRAFADYRVTTKLMKRAAPHALFMHCLPAYREVEVDSAVIDGVQSVVWEEAANRLHAQQALLEYLLCG